MKSILISIRPEWVAKILNGEKTIEIRTSKPKRELPIDVYIYCTKGKEELYEAFKPLGEKAPYQTKPKNQHLTSGLLKEGSHLNGKVVGKFRLDEIYKYQIEDEHTWKDPSFEETTQKLMGMGLEELHNYVGNKTFYGWHISDLEIFDEPKPLSEFGLKRAPQSYCYVEVEE